METIIGFIAGYYLGTRQGREGLERFLNSAREIAASEEVRDLAAGAADLAGGVLRQQLGGVIGASAADKAGAWIEKLFSGRTPLRIVS